MLGISQPLYINNNLNNLYGINVCSAYLCFLGYIYPFMVLKNFNIFKGTVSIFITSLTSFLISLYWIFIAVYVYGDVKLSSSILITTCLPLILSMKTTVFFVVAAKFSKLKNINFYFIAPIALCGVEFFRNYYLFGGFPWANAGYSLARIDEFLQLASLVGIYGMVLFIGIINSFLAQFLEKLNMKLLMPISLLLILIFSFGYYRLSLPLQIIDSVKIAIAQGNVDQYKKNKQDSLSDINNIYKNLSEDAANENVDLLIWPESSYPYQLKENIVDFEVAKQYKLPLIFGAVSFGYDAKDEFGYHYQNSAFFTDNLGNIIARYDKSHLVPFGEYVPWPMQKIVDKIVPGMGAFKRGENNSLVTMSTNSNKKIKLGLNICYEGIFPEQSRRLALQKPDLLINITNDAWYGISSAPYQHLLMYRVRAAETAKTYIRATNSGVSAIIDPFGRIIQSTDLFVRELIIADVKIYDKISSFYLYIGDLLGIICLLIIASMTLLVAFPVKEYVLNKKYFYLILSFTLIFLFLASYIYFAKSKVILDESFYTKVLLGFIVLFYVLYVISKCARNKLLDNKF